MAAVSRPAGGGRGIQISSDLPKGSALTFLRALVVLLGVWFVAAWGLFLLEDLRLSSTMPRAPDPASGYTLPATANHSTVYLNEQELARRNRIDWFFTSGFIPFIVIAFIQQRWEVFPPYTRRR